VSATPRPWSFEVVDGEDCLRGWITGPNLSANVVCDLVPRTGGGITDEDIANGELIVAAVNSYAAHLKAVEALRALLVKHSQFEQPLIDMAAVASVHGYEWTAGDWCDEVRMAELALAAVDEVSR
jgi:hypothetical protein